MITPQTLYRVPSSIPSRAGGHVSHFSNEQNSQKKPSQKECSTTPALRMPSTEMMLSSPHTSAPTQDQSKTKFIQIGEVSVRLMEKNGVTTVQAPGPHVIAAQYFQDTAPVDTRYQAPAFEHRPGSNGASSLSPQRSLTQNASTSGQQGNPRLRLDILV